MSDAEPDTIASSLLERVRRHDPAGWACLTDLFSSTVYRWVRRAGVPEADAADVVQDVFLDVARSVAGFRRDRPGDTFTGWVRTISARRAADYFRRNRGPAPVGGTDAVRRLEQVPEDVLSSMDDDPTGELVRRGLAVIRGEFEERTWKAFEGTAVGGRPAAEVAAELGLSVGAVYVARSRVTRRLREALAGIV